MLLPKLLIQSIEGNRLGHKLRGAENKTLSLFNSTFYFYQYKSEFFKYIFVFLQKCFTKSSIYNCISSVIFVLFTRQLLSKKYPYSDIFQPLFPHIQTEYRIYSANLHKFPYSVRIHQNTDHKYSEYKHYSCSKFSKLYYF